jgi:hypothetical protein
MRKMQEAVWPQEKGPALRMRSLPPSGQYRLTLPPTAEIATAAVHTPLATAATDAGRPALTPPPAPQTTSDPSTITSYCFIHLFTPFRGNLFAIR